MPIGPRHLAPVMIGYWGAGLRRRSAGAPRDDVGDLRGKVRFFFTRNRFGRGYRAVANHRVDAERACQARGTVEDAVPDPLRGFMVHWSEADPGRQCMVT